MKEDISKASADTLSDIIMRSNKASQQLKNMSNMEAAEKAVLNYYSTDMENVSDADFIRLVEQMSVGNQFHSILNIYLVTKTEVKDRLNLLPYFFHFKNI